MSSFYKYCPIFNHEKLDEELSLINLFSNQVPFSRRNYFNDLFDSKVEFILPNKNDVKSTYEKLSGKSKYRFKNLYMGNNSPKHFELIKIEMNKILDSFLFYCLTDNPENNLMWSHYSNSHNGFCIEWNGHYINPQKVIYQETIAKVDLLKLLQASIGLKNMDLTAEELWNAVRTKLSEWKYEQEYRFQLGNHEKHLIVKDFGKGVLIKAQPEWIKAIIFGYRMPQETRMHIINKLSQGTVFKEVKVNNSLGCLKVVNLE